MNAVVPPPHPAALQKGAALVSGPDDGVSYWQPLPSTGYTVTKLSPLNSPINHLAAGIQVVEPGMHVRNHAHQCNDELLFVYEGTGHALIDGVRHELAAGALIAVGRYVEHKVFNTGTTQMKIFWVFTPPGLEDWFGAIGQPRRAGDAPPPPFPRPDGVDDIHKKVKFVPGEKLQQG